MRIVLEAGCKKEVRLQSEKRHARTHFPVKVQDLNDFFIHPNVWLFIPEFGLKAENGEGAAHSECTPEVLRGFPKAGLGGK